MLFSFRANSALLLVLGLTAFAPSAVAPAAAQELRISHQFHETGDARGRASRIFAEELGLRAPEIKTRSFRSSAWA